MQAIIYKKKFITKKGEKKTLTIFLRTFGETLLQGSLRRLHRVFAQCWRARLRYVFLENFYVFAFQGD